jgi:hypothetical protein
MHYDDLNPYNYFESKPKHKVVCVGWLDKNVPFKTGHLSCELRTLIWNYSRILVYETMGFHGCELCQVKGPIRCFNNNEELLLGSAEVRFFSKDKVYACPNLLYHYIEHHNYLPADEFIKCLEVCSPLPSTKYFGLLKSFGFPWRQEK